MAKKVTSVRVETDLLAWAEGYADQRGVSKTAVFEAGLRSLKEDARAGVPELDPEPAESPAPKPGTEGWRDPTPGELEQCREHHPDLEEDRLFRLARAEAHIADMGLPQLKRAKEMTREAQPPIGPGGGDFERFTRARGVALSGRAASRAQEAAGGGTIATGKFVLGVPIEKWGQMSEPDREEHKREWFGR